MVFLPNPGTSTHGQNNKTTPLGPCQVHHISFQREILGAQTAALLQVWGSGGWITKEHRFFFFNVYVSFLNKNVFWEKRNVSFSISIYVSSHEDTWKHEDFYVETRRIGAVPCFLDGYGSRRERGDAPKDHHRLQWGGKTPSQTR